MNAVLEVKKLPIVMRLDRVMAERKITSTELANGHIRGMRFSTLEALCQVLNCKPGDIIDYMTPEEEQAERTLGEIRERNYEKRS